MKRIQALAMPLALIVALAIVGTAFATAELPPEPTCPEGQITTTPAVWVEDVVEVIHHDATTHEITVVDQSAWDEWVPPVTHVVHHDAVLGCPTVTWRGGLFNWYSVTFTYRLQAGQCHRPTAQSLGVPVWLRGQFNHDNPQLLGAVVVTPAWDEIVVDVPGYFIHHDAVTHQETIVDQEAWDETVVVALGYWTDPVCSEPVCEVTPLYTMYVLQDFDAPVGYLQQGTCYIESPSYPSVGSQAAFCTFPFEGTGWTFRTDRAPYAGEVSIDCHGNVHFGWPAWDPAWVR